MGGCVVVTGFEPFGGASTNPSWDAVVIAADELRASGIDVVTERLPVEFDVAPRRVGQLLSAHRPAVFIAAGVAGRASKIRLERLAVNRIDARIPDNVGRQPHGLRVSPSAPTALRTTLPFSIEKEWASHRIPGELSDDAGRYVCNATFYALQLAARTALGTSSTGFIHVPPADVMPVAVSAKAIEIAVRESLAAQPR